ncbi:MAG: GGDEF domain-containing protein [Butyrivibrio sp.]|nr:GGDEF domain-containing protein [Butyrivibrio sp.]
MKFWTHQRYYKLIAIIIFLICIFVVLISAGNLFDPVEDIYNLNRNWIISYNNKILPSDTLLNSGVGIVDEGDTVTLKTTLPDFDLEYPCGSLYTIHSIIDVYVANELVYSFGRNYYDSGKTVPHHANFFPLGRDYEGKELLIILRGTKKDSFSGLSPVIVSSRHNLFKANVLHLHHNIILGAFLITMGLTLMVLSPYMIIYHSNDFRLFFSGLISMLLGLYTYSYYCIVDLLCGNVYLNSICEYSSLYNIPTAILGYLSAVYNGKLKKLFKVLFSINLCMFFLVFITTVFGKVTISDYAPLLYVVAIIESTLSIFVISYDYIKGFKENKKHSITSDNAFAIGLICFVLLSLVDIIKYYLNKYVNGRGDAYSDINFFLAGSIILLASLLLSYLLHIIYNSNLESMQSRITSLAYTDPLTGLANRARCEQVMEMLSQEHSTYTIISMDLNKLKYVNDTLGHREGDRLLSGFATILSDCFIDANLVGRMGGDEFMIVLTEDRALNVTRRIHEFYSMINDWNRKEQSFQYSASYGYAYSHEVPSGLAQEVYMLADSRMYEMKKEHQQNRDKEVMRNA